MFLVSTHLTAKTIAPLRFNLNRLTSAGGELPCARDCGGDPRARDCGGDPRARDCGGDPRARDGGGEPRARTDRDREERMAALGNPIKPPILGYNIMKTDWIHRKSLVDKRHIVCILLIMPPTSTAKGSRRLFCKVTICKTRTDVE